MTIDVVVDDVADALLVDVARWSALAHDVLVATGFNEDAELSLRFVGPAEIARLNQQHLGRSGPTDVLSFPIEDDPVEQSRAEATVAEAVPVLLGDVVICPEIAYANAPEHAGTYDAELALLIVHGILHLFGMDHQRDDEAAAMEARERELLATFFVRDGAPW